MRKVKKSKSDKYQKDSKSHKGKANESTQRDCSTFRYFSTFRDFWTPVTWRALQQKSSRIDPNVAFAPTDGERIWRSKHAAPMTFKKRRPPKGPGKPRDLLAGDSFYHRSLFVHFSTFRKKFGEQVDPAHTFSHHSKMSLGASSFMHAFGRAQFRSCVSFSGVHHLLHTVHFRTSSFSSMASKASMLRRHTLRVTPPILPRYTMNDERH